MKLTCNSGKLLIAFLFRPSRNSAGISELFIPATAPHHPQCPEKSNAKSGMIQYDSYKKWIEMVSLLLKISLEILEWPVLHGELLLAWHLHLPNAGTRHYRVSDTCSGLLKNDR